MTRFLFSVVVGYCVALLPIAMVIAGAHILPQLYKPNPTFPIGASALMESAFVSGIFAYMFGIFYSLPFFGFFRILAALLGYTTYVVAGLVGGLTAALALAAVLYFENLRLSDIGLAGHVVMVFVQFIVVGIMSGLLYLFIERSLPNKLFRKLERRRAV